MSGAMLGNSAWRWEDARQMGQRQYRLHAAPEDTVRWEVRGDHSNMYTWKTTRMRL